MELRELFLESLKTVSDQDVVADGLTDLLGKLLLLHYCVDEVKFANEFIRVFFELLCEYEELPVDDGIDKG